MRTSKQMRRAFAVASAGLLAIGGLGTLAGASALAAGTTIYSSGAALQAQLQNDILIPDSGLTKIIYTSTSSGAGYDEFGNNTGALNLEKDPTGFKIPQLDAYVATDSGPTAAQLLAASTKAAGGGTNEISVPVAQTPLDLLLSLPSGITLSTKQNIDLGNLLAGQLYAGTVPAGGGYPTNSWGALLTDAGLSKTATSPPSTNQFNETKGVGTKAISVEVRKNGAGTTFNLKQYLKLVDSADWGSILLDQNAYGTKEWPSTANLLPTTTGNSADSDEVTAVDGTPGTVGYATQGDGAANKPPFTNKPLISTKGATHQILYAFLQDNGTGTKGQKFGDPELGTKANVYTGSEIQFNTNGNGGVGNWIVPNKGGATFDPTGTWDGTQASDPDVVDHEPDGVQYYPLVAVAFDLSWSNFSAKLLAPNYTLASPSAAQTLAQQFLSYATSSTGGQSAILHGPDFYAPLPTGGAGLADIRADAAAAAAIV